MILALETAKAQLALTNCCFGYLSAAGHMALPATHTHHPQKMTSMTELHFE